MINSLPKATQARSVWYVRWYDGEFLESLNDDGTVVWTADKRKGKKFRTEKAAQEVANYWPGQAKILRSVREGDLS